MKILKILFTLSFFMLIWAEEKERHNIHFKSIQCKVSGKTAFANFTCFTKAYSRTLTTVTVEGYSKRNLSAMFAEGHLEYKYGTIYREVMKASNVNLCQILKQKANIANILYRQIMQVAKDNIPEMIHDCPYNVC